MGLDDLEKYVQEVVHGVHDHWMNDTSNPNRWTYTYHQRLFDYDGLNQIEKCVQLLKECPYTRRAQAVTWQSWIDMDHDDPPCLQSIWLRIQDNKLNMNVRFRSNDLFKAAFPNMVALTELQALIARQLNVEVGGYIHLSDSMHIYGKDHNELQGFFALLKKRTFANRTWTSSSAAGTFVDGCTALLNEVDMPDEKKRLILERKAYWEQRHRAVS
jgi:thymidylate synthase